MIGIYCRTSKARNEKYTIENQKDEGVKFAKKNGLPYKIYIDDGISGTEDESTRKKISNTVRVLTELPDEKDIPKELSNTLMGLQQTRTRLSNELKSLENRISIEESGLSEQKLQNAQILINGIRTKLNTPENFEIIRKIIRSIIDSIVVEFNSETQSYFLKINLIGKEEALFVVHNRFKEVWTFTDEKGNEDFSEENKPLWMNNISFSYVKSGEKFYRYGLLIKKKDYFYFD